MSKSPSSSSDETPEKMSPSLSLSFKPKGDDETDKLLANMLKDLNIDLGNITIAKIGECRRAF